MRFSIGIFLAASAAAFSALADEPKTMLRVRSKCDLGLGKETCFDLPTACVPREGVAPPASECGVFVSSSLGDDAAKGDAEHPLKTIGMALALGRPIYACAEDFNEALVVPAGAKLFGGLHCRAGWVVTGGAQTTVFGAAGVTPIRFVPGHARIVFKDFVVVKRGSPFAADIQGVDVEFMNSRIGSASFGAPTMLPELPPRPPEPPPAALVPPPDAPPAYVPPPRPEPTWVPAPEAPRVHDAFFRMDFGVPLTFNRIGNVWDAGAGITLGVGFDVPFAKDGAVAMGLTGRGAFALTSRVGALSNSPLSKWELFQFTGGLGPFVSTPWADFRLTLTSGLWAFLPKGQGSQAYGPSFGPAFDMDLHLYRTDPSKPKAFTVGLVQRFETDWAGAPAWTYTTGLELKVGR